MATEVSRSNEITIERLNEIAMESAENLSPEAEIIEARALVSGFINTLGLAVLADPNSILVSNSQENILSFEDFSREALVNSLVACCGWPKEICEMFLEKLETEIKELAEGRGVVEIERLGDFVNAEDGWRLHM